MARGAPLLVTGAAGFIGARFVESCGARGIPVVSVDRARAASRERPEHRGLDFGDDRRLRRAARAGSRASAPRARRHRPPRRVHRHDRDGRRLPRRVNLEYSQTLWRYAARAAASRSSTRAAPRPTATARSATTTTRRCIPQLRAAQPVRRVEAAVRSLRARRGARRPPRRRRGPASSSSTSTASASATRATMASVVLHAFDQIRAGGEVRLFKSHRPGLRRRRAAARLRRSSTTSSTCCTSRSTHAAAARHLQPRHRAQRAPSSTSRTRPSRRSACPPRIRFIDMPEGLRARYQYFDRGAHGAAARRRLRGARSRRSRTACARYVERLQKDAPPPRRPAA